jgi:hypothetical protein
VVEWKDGKGFGHDIELHGKIRAITDRQGLYRLEFSSDFEQCYLGFAAKGLAPSISRNVKPGTPQEPAVVNFTFDDLAPGTYVLEWTHGLPRPPEIDVAGLSPLARSDLEALYTRATFRRRVDVKEGLETEVELGKDLGSLTLRGRLVLEGFGSPGDAKIVLRPASGDSEEISLRTGTLLEWRFACPFLRPGKYAVETVIWAEGEKREVSLTPLEMSGDLERDFEVTAGGR